jgi:MFS family permease
MSQSDENDILSPPAAESEWRALLKPQYLASTVMLCMGVALYAFNGFLVSTVLPSAVADIGGAQLMSWSLTLYIAASIVAGAGGASLKANFGARRALISGSLLFLIGTFFAATAQDMGFVLVGRVLQGAGEGLVAAICYSLIPEMFPAAMVTKVFGAEAMVWAVAAFVGPVLSGALTDMFSWRMAFLINVPVAGLFILMAVLLVPKGNKPDDRARFPGLRLILLSAGLTALLVADLGGNLVMTVLIIALAGAMIALAIRTDRKASAPILPQGAFSLHSTLGLGLWVVLLMPVSQATGSVYLVFAMQNLFGLTTTMAGAIGALMAIGWSLTAIAIANLDSRAARMTAIWLGSLALIAGLALLVAAMAWLDLTLVIAGQVLIGIAFGASWGHLSQMLMEEAETADRDKTAALLPTLQSAGYGLGGAIAGLSANQVGLHGASDRSSIQSAMAITFAVALLWAIAGFIAAKRATSLRARGTIT